MNRHLSIALAAFLAVGCTDLVTTDIGRGEIAAIEIDRRFSLDQARPRDLCPTLTRELPPGDARAASASLAPVEIGCELTLRVEDAVLVSAASMEQHGDAVGDRDTTAIVGIDVEVDELLVEDGAGVRLGQDEVGHIVLELEGTEVVRMAGPTGQEAPIRGSLPQSLVDDFVAGLESGAEVRGDVEVRAIFTDASHIPDESRIYARLQPILRVDVVRAAL